MNRTRVKWVAAGNEAVGFVAFGNLATGFIAVGNVARGFFAFGNLAIGVVAFGNVGFGIVAGGGATVGIGLYCVAGVVALPVLDGTAGLLTGGSLLGLLPVALWLGASQVLRGERPAAPDVPELADPATLRSGERRDGWVKGKLGVPHDGLVPLAVGRERWTVEIGGSVHEGLPVFAGKPVLVRLLVEERAGTAGYREAPPIERVLVAEDVMLVPRPPAAWARSSFVQWYLSRAWLVGGLVGGMLWMAVRVLG